MANTRSSASRRAAERRASRPAATPAALKPPTRRGARPVRKPAATAPKPKPSTEKAGPTMPDRLKNSPPAPKLPAASRRPASPARTVAATKPKAPAAKPAATKPKAAETSGIGPVKAGDSYSRKINSLQEQVRKLREMREASIKRQGK
jgi:hypothetical protein